MAGELSSQNKAFREKLINTIPIICPEHAVIQTEVWRENEDKPPVLKAAIALRETLKRMTIEIYDEDLIAGNQGSGLRASSMNPASNTWFVAELDDFDKRSGSRFTITEEAKEKIREIAPYWKGRTVVENAMALIPEASKDAMDALVFTCGATLGKGCGHWLLNFESVLLNGFTTFRERAKKMLEEIDYSDAEGVRKIPFYEAIVITCDSVREFAARYAALAREKARSADAERARELEEIAAVCDRVPFEAPKTFREAVQAVFFVQVITHIESDATGISLGRLDNMLFPFYERDIKSGLITKEEAKDILDNLWLKIASIIQVFTAEDTKAFGGHPISQAITLGGMDVAGNDATNEMSYMMLETTARVRMAQPSVCVRVNKNSPDDFLLYCSEVIREGLGMPAMYNDEIAVPSLVSRGVAVEDARRDWAVIGCVEMGIQGKLCAFANCGYANLVKCLELTLNDGRDPVTGRQLGPHTGKAAEFASFNDLLDAYYIQMKYLLDLMAGVTNIVETKHAELLPLPFVSSITEDCVGAGKEALSGGAKYNYDGIQGVGLADAADSLAAIKKLVFEEQQVSMEDLLAAVNANFAGYETIRAAVIKSVPKYGNNDPYADEIAHSVAYEFCSIVEKYENPRGGFFIPGLYSNSANIPLGAVCGATPNGRFACAPIAEACSPSHHMDKHGPTQAALSVAALDHLIVTNGTQYNQKYHPASLAGSKGLRALTDLYTTFFDSGGFHIQFNVVSSEQLRAAQENPRENNDVVVRVAGYTAFFVDLDRNTQNDIIDRTELSFM